MNKLFNKRIIATLLLIIPFYATAFPKDLMYLGKPIHPACICAIRPLAGSPEPQAVYSKEANEFPYTFNEPSNTVTCEDHSEYIYIGTYKNMHLVLSYEYEKGSGVFADLGLIERHRNKIVNVGTIAAGDRGCGGTIQVEEFKDGILRYSQIFYHMGCASKSFKEPVQLFFEVDIDPKRSKKNLWSGLYNIIFLTKAERK